SLGSTDHGTRPAGHLGREQIDHLAASCGDPEENADLVHVSLVCSTGWTDAVLDENDTEVVRHRIAAGPFDAAAGRTTRDGDRAYTARPQDVRQLRIEECTVPNFAHEQVLRLRLKAG